MMNMNDERYLTMLQEQKKVAVVTGRANGIGKCIAAACRSRRKPGAVLGRNTGIERRGCDEGL